MSLALQSGAPHATQEELAARFEGAAERASVVLAFALLGALTASLLLDALAPLALAGPLALGLLAWQLRAFGSARSRLPNLVTALRVVLTSLLALAPATTGGRWLQAGAIGLVFTLDGLDGYLARTLHASSLQGARFDMETDGYLVLVVCSVHALAGMGAWVLIGGLLRYAYVLTLWLFGRRGQPPRVRFARYAFALSLATLTLALVTRGASSALVAGLGTATLFHSFARSLVWALAGDRAHDARSTS
jgi:phosphatidylglycerophosphate synthase